MEYITKTFIKEPIIKIYPYGSRVYGHFTSKSDYDYIAIVESNEELYYSVNYNKSNITVYSEKLFIKKIENHEISILECIFQDDTDEYRRHFHLHLPSLRRSISSVASNSFVKCKKKLKEGEYYIGKKSLYHSLRILLYGIQIARDGKITDYKLEHLPFSIFKDIVQNESNDWDYYKKNYQPIYNELKSYFRKLAPLEEELNA